MNFSKKVVLLLGALIIQASALKAQAPTITAIDYNTNYPNEVLIISGLYYSTDPTKMKVLFGGVEGNVLSSTGSVIEVEIPGNASAESIHVINTTNGLSVFTPNKFYPTFHGSAFDINDLQDPVLLNSLGQLFDVCACDFDGDGLRDVVTSKSDNDSNLEIARNVTVDPTNLQFIQTTFAATGNGRYIVCKDLNGDGKPEVIYARNDTGNRHFLHILLNTSTVGNISFSMINSPLQMSTTTSNAIRIQINDLDFDGKPDVIVSNSDNNEISIFKNQSSGGAISFASAPVQIEVLGATITGGLEVQDMDGDNKPELIVAQLSSTNIYVLKNNSGVNSISFADAVQFDMNKSIQNVKVGDLNGDGLADIAVTHRIEGSMSVIKNNSSLTSLDFQLAGNWATSARPWGIDMGDLDGDGDLDMVVTDRESPTINVFTNITSDPNTINFSSSTKSVPSEDTWNTIIADMNNDDKPDILYTTATTRIGGVFFHTGIIRNTNCFIPEIIGDATRFMCDQPIELKSIHNNGAVFNWYKDGVLEQGPAHGVNTANSSQFTATVPGVYKVIMEAEGGACNLESNTITINPEAGTVPGMPTAINDGPTCAGDDVTLNVTFAGAPPGGITYEWTGPNGFTSTDMSPVITNVSPDNVGNYTLVVASGQCQTSEVSTVVEVYALPEFSVTTTGNVALCTGETLPLSVTNRSGYSYQWLLNGSVITGETSVSYISAAAGKYSVEVTDLGTLCKIITNEIELFIYDTPGAVITLPPTFCLDESLQFSADQSTIDGNATVTYAWDFGNTVTSDILDPVVQYSTTGVFDIQLTVDYEETSCPDLITQSITIVAPELLSIISSNDGVCGEDDVELSTNIELTNILWSTTETTQTIFINTAGTYSVDGNEANGCVVTSNITLADKEVPRLVITATPTSIVSGDVLNLSVTGADSYLWSPEESLSDPTAADPLATPVETIYYKVLGTITDGCSALDSILVEVRPAISSAYKVLNPNGVNPVIVIENKLSDSPCSLTIFDRYGSKVYEDEGDIVDWDGTGFNGKMPQDTYFYILKCDGVEPTTGSILLIRS